MLALLFAPNVEAGEIAIGGTQLLYKGAIGMELWHFPQQSNDPQHEDNVTTLDTFMELTLKMPGNLDLRFRPICIFDFADADFAYEELSYYGKGRSRIRIDDLYLDWFSDLIEIRFGYQIFSWETVESYNWADFLNQTDREIDLFDPEKIGEPAVRVRFPLPTDVDQYLEFYYFPYFTPARFPRTGNRYDLFSGRRYAVGSNPDYADYHLPDDYTVPIVQSNELEDMVYGSDDERWRPQWAARYQTSLLDSIDFALYFFNGYERSPRFVPKEDPAMVLPIGMGGRETLLLVHHYDIVTKLGFTFQGNRGPWLFKGETLYQLYEQEIVTKNETPVDDYYAFTTGLEYTLYGLFFDNQDVGLILEWIECSEEGKDLVTYPNHFFGGIRYTFNNPSNRSILLGGYFNNKDHENVIRLEYSERLGEQFTLELEGLLVDADDDSLFGPFNDSSRIGGKITWHF